MRNLVVANMKMNLLNAQERERYLAWMDKELKKKVKNAAWELTLETGIVVTTLLFSRYEIEESPLRSSPFIHTIMEEGVQV